MPSFLDTWLRLVRLLQHGRLFIARQARLLLLICTDACCREMPCIDARWLAHCRLLLQAQCIGCCWLLVSEWTSSRCMSCSVCSTRTILVFDQHRVARRNILRCSSYVRCVMQVCYLGHQGVPLEQQRVLHEGSELHDGGGLAAEVPHLATLELQIMAVAPLGPAPSVYHGFQYSDEKCSLIVQLPHGEEPRIATSVLRMMAQICSCLLMIRARLTETHAFAGFPILYKVLPTDTVSQVKVRRRHHMHEVQGYSCVVTCYILVPG